MISWTSIGVDAETVYVTSDTTWNDGPSFVSPLSSVSWYQNFLGGIFSFQFFLFFFYRRWFWNESDRKRLYFWRERKKKTIESTHPLMLFIFILVCPSSGGVLQTLLGVPTHQRDGCLGSAIWPRAPVPFLCTTVIFVRSACTFPQCKTRWNWMEIMVNKQKWLLAGVANWKEWGKCARQYKKTSTGWGSTDVEERQWRHYAKCHPAVGWASRVLLTKEEKQQQQTCTQSKCLIQPLLQQQLLSKAGADIELDDPYPSSSFSVLGEPKIKIKCTRVTLYKQVDPDNI